MSDDPASKHGLRWEIRRSLIERLRIRWDAMGDMANQQRYEASVQISLMMDELEGWQAAMQKAERDMQLLRDERDEARRKICEMEAECIVYPPCSPQQYAVRMGWDCFKEKP